jgi:hypothetical protein
VARHGYYWTAHWKALRQAALKRDGGRCTAPRCTAPATTVDHIMTRPPVGFPTAADRLENLRPLCATHDAQIKERSDGRRGRGDRPLVKVCDIDGWPLAPV